MAFTCFYGRKVSLQLNHARHLFKINSINYRNCNKIKKVSRATCYNLEVIQGNRTRFKLYTDCTSKTETLYWSIQCQRTSCHRMRTHCLGEDVLSSHDDALHARGLPVTRGRTVRRKTSVRTTCDRTSWTQGRTFRKRASCHHRMTQTLPEDILSSHEETLPVVGRSVITWGRTASWNHFPAPRPRGQCPSWVRWGRAGNLHQTKEINCLNLHHCNEVEKLTPERSI